MDFKQRFAATAFAAAACIAHAAAPRVAATPSIPFYGQSVNVAVSSSDWPVYLPATRYWRTGNTFTIDYEYLTDGFGPSRPDFGYLPISLGELAAGNYTIQARFFDIGRPNSEPQVVSASLGVMPPDAWGIYTVPALPNAFDALEAMVRSAAYFNAGSMRASQSGNVIRVDFDYYGDKPVGGPIPPGLTSFAAVKIAGLAPGSYRLEGWGRDLNASGSAPERYFTRDVAIGTLTTITEYYAPALDHYFLSAWSDERAKLDASPQLGFLRTSQRFKAWLRQGDAPPGAGPVCRFYASGPNSHFYTGDASECQYLKSLEHSQRADAAARGQPFTGWQYEAIAFYALVPQGGKCPGDTQPVYRVFNMRSGQNDANHRFMVDPQQRAAMVGWADEGVAFCSPL